MKRIKTLLEKLSDNLEVTRLTKKPSTFRGRKSAVRLLLLALEKLNITSIEQLEDDPILTARLIHELGEQVRREKWGSTRNTTSQKYQQMCAILTEIGCSARLVKIFRDSKATVLDKGPTLKPPQETITQEQMDKVMKILKELDKRDDFRVKGSKPTKKKRAMVRLYVLMAASFAIRRSTLELMRSQDFDTENITYFQGKGGRKGEPTTRSMNRLVWGAYQDYMKHFDKPPEKLFTDLSGISASVKVIMKEAGVAAHNGRHGTHRFRRAFAKWAYNKNIPVPTISAGLNHEDTRSTERVYRDLTEKQQKASQVLAEFAEQFLKMKDHISDLEKELEDVKGFLGDMLRYGQPTFNDEEMDLVYLDAQGNLQTLSGMVPAPRLELGTP